MSVDLNQIIGGVYAAPLAEFTAKRDEAVRQLRSSGQATAAASVAKLRKPPLPVWTVNQLAKRQSAEVEELLKAGAELRDLQAQAQSGARVGAQALRESAEAERVALDALVRRAAGLLSMTGHPATDQVLSRVRQVLHSAATGDAARDELREGRLTSELGPAGFAGTVEQPAPKQRPKNEQDAQRLESARRDAQVAWRSAKELERDAGQFRSEADHLASHARVLADQADAARERAFEAEQVAKRAERKARAARAAADEAAATVEKLGH